MEETLYRLIDQLIEIIQTNNLHSKIVITSIDAANLDYIQQKDSGIQLAIDENELGVKTAVSHHFGYCLMSIDNMSKSLYTFSVSTELKSLPIQPKIL